MPTQKYRVETDKGSYEVEVEEPYRPTPIPGFSTPLVPEMDESGKAVTPKEGPVNSFLRRTSENPILRRMGHPQSMGDFLSLLIPEVPRALAPAAMRGLKSFREGGFKGVRNWAFGKPQYTQEATGQLWNELPEAVKAEYLPGGPRAGGAKVPPNPEKVGGPPYEPIPREGLNDLPTYRQQQILEQSGTKASSPSGGHRGGGPPARAPQPKPAEAGKLTGNRAKSFEDELAEGLDMEKARLSPEKMTLPGEPTITPGGPTHQSGKFSKSGSAGQPGGFTSGRPSVTPKRYDEMVSPQTEEDLYQAVTEKMGMGQSNPSVETIGAGPHPEMAAERAVGGEPLPGLGSSGNSAAAPKVSPSPAGPSAAIPLGPSPVEGALRLESPFPSGGEFEWHSGAEAGSAEAAAARKLHRGSGESTVPSVFKVAGIDELLAEILRRVP